MKAAQSRGKRLGRPSTHIYLVEQIEQLAGTTDLSIRKIHQEIMGKAGRGVVGNIVKRIRSNQQVSL